MADQLRIDSITVPDTRMRPLGDVSALAESIAQNGLINPITVARDGTLISGRHRLEACKRLGWTDIPANVTDLEGLRAELAEIDENLVRSELTVLQQAEHLARRAEILEALGLRAKVGDNQHTAGGETVSPPLTTAQIAAELGLSERAAQQRLQIARKVAPDVRDMLADTPAANSTRTLLELARLGVEEQRTAAEAEAERWRDQKNAAARAATVKEALARAERLGLMRYEGAIRARLIKATKHGSGLSTATKGDDLLPGVHWPRYTSMEYCTPLFVDEKQDRTRFVDVPTFTEQEWEEWTVANAAESLAATYPGLEKYGDGQYQRLPAASGAENRREYDPDYGGEIVEPDCDICDVHFIRQGWGVWQVVEFNDGEGGRTKRRYFEQDWYGETLIKEAFATVDPRTFSHWQYRSLSIHSVQRMETSWAYIRKEALSREEIIAAMEADLALLKDRPETPPDEATLLQHALGWLQKLTVEVGDSADFREGRASCAVTSEGLMDWAAYRARQGRDSTRHHRVNRGLDHPPPPWQR